VRKRKMGLQGSRVPLALAAAAAALAASGGCVYTSESALPAHIKTVRVEVFENRTGYPGLEAELARLLVREFQADGTLVPGGRFADSVLRGTLARVGRSVLQEDASDDVVTGQVTVSAVVTLEDSAGDAPLLASERVTSSDARGSEGVFRRATGGTEAAALDASLRELARNIVRRAVEAW
jgi:hypothetical protein